MSVLILVKAGLKYYKARVNPSVPVLRSAIKRQMKRGRLASVVRMECQIRRIQRKKNPLVSSKYRASVGKNISWLLRHPKELTAKTPEMRRKQAIAIALSVWRRAGGK